MSLKISSWAYYNNFTNEEKTSYKIKQYTKTFCEKLNIPEMLISDISSLVLDTLNISKKHSGSKRAKVKDGIIIVCINYICKNNGIYFKYKDLATLANIDIKYIYNGEKIINEFINTGKLNYDINLSKNSYETLLGIIKSKKVKISDEILIEFQTISKVCETNDSLSDHYKTSIALGCLYYVMSKYEPIDINMFCKIFDISNATLTKVVEKLNKIFLN